MLRTVHLHGQLGKRFGRSFEMDVASPVEAIRALTFQLPGFSKYISHRRYAVTVGTGTAVTADALDLQLGKTRDIHITPAGLVSGLETVLLVGTLLLTAVSTIMVLSMPKVPTAAAREDATKTASFVFDGADNVSEQGHPVPLVYGVHRVGSVVVSAGIATTDVNAAGVGADPTNPVYTGGGGAGGGSYPGLVGVLPGINGSEFGNEWVTLQKGGGKGGGGTARSAQEDPNSLQSQATAKVLDVVSEGEIVGLVDGLKSVYFDDTPLQNPDGTFNFAGVAVEQRLGLPDQDFIPGFTQSENSREIDTKVAVLTGPVTRSINDEDVTVARVTIRLPQLYQQDTTNGDLKATTVEVRISVQADGGGFTDVTTMTFSGKTNGGYQRSVDIRLPNGVQRDIRVTRLTPDSDVASLTNETRWDLLTEIVEAKLSYPDTALIGLTVDARQFGSSIPARSYEIKGLVIEVPSNYDPVARTYTGVWDGTFKRAWTDNPAWVFRDLIVNRRYGLGQRVAATAVDKWGLYAIAQHNDGLVPDGFGGMEPRYTINVCINNPAQAYDVLASVASNFRGMAYWGSGSVVATQDRPEDPSILITPSNVVDGRISYGRVTPVENRRSVSVVYWNDPADGYRLTPEIKEDPDLIRRFGRRGGGAEDAVTAYGVTRRGQAHRAALWILEDEAPGSNSTASYSVGDDHSYVEPGRVTEIADPMFTQNRRGGRVREANANQIVTDAPVNIVAGQDHYLRVMLPDGTVSRRHITTGPGATTLLSLEGGAWAVPPLPGAVWTVETDVIANRQWRVRQIMTDEAPYEVRAVLHDPTKWDRVELDRNIDTPAFLDLPVGPLLKPSDIDVFEFLLRDGDAAVPAAQVSWLASTDARVAFYQAQFKRPGGNWEPFADGSAVSRVVRGVEPGNWAFRVRALDSLGRKTEWVESAFDLDAQVDALPSVSGVMVLTDDDTLQSMIVWVKPTDRRPLRFDVLFDTGGDLDNAILLATVDTQEYVVSQVGTYWVRTTFLGVGSTSPPFVEVTADDLPVVRYDDPDRTPVNHLRPAAPGATPGALDGDTIGGTYDDNLGVVVGGRPVPEFLAEFDGAIEATDRLTDLTDTIAGADRQRRADLAKLSEAVARLVLGANDTRQTLADAGVVTDPVTGKVYIYGVSQTQEKISEVSVRLDSAMGQIALKASTEYVDQAVLNAQFPELEADLSAVFLRITNVEATLDAQAATIALKADETTVSGLAATVNGVSLYLDAVAAEVSLKATSTELDEVSTRVTSVEQTLTAAGDIAGTTIDIRQVRYLVDRLGQTLQSSILAGDDEKNARIYQIASLRSELYTKIVDDVSVESTARQALSVRMGTAESALLTEATARATADTAQTSRITAAESLITSPTSGLAAAHSRITTEQSTRATADTAITLSVSTLSAQVNNPSTGLPSAHSRITTEETVRASAVATVAARVTVTESQMAGTTGSYLNSRIATEESTRSTGDATNASAIAVVSSMVTNPSTGLAAAHSRITSEESTRATADSANASATAALSAQVNNPSTGLPAAHSRITTEESVRATADATAAGRITTTESQLAGTTGSFLNSRIATEESTRATGDATNATAISTLTSTVTNPTTGLPAAHSRITTEETTRASADTAQAARITTTESQLAGVTGSVLGSRIATEESTRASADSTQATRITATESQLAGTADSGLKSRIVTEESTRASADATQAGRITTTESQLAGNTGSFLNSRIANEESTRAAGDSTNATAISSLSSQVGGIAGGLATAQADISNEAYTRATADSAQATAISNVSSQVGANTAAITSAQTSINGLSLRYSVRLDSNGYVTGFIQNNNGSESDFTISAAYFRVVAPGFSARSIFEVDTVNDRVKMTNVEVDTISFAAVGPAQMQNSAISQSTFTQLQNDVFIGYTPGGSEGSTPQSDQEILLPGEQVPGGYTGTDAFNINFNKQVSDSVLRIVATGNFWSSGATIQLEAYVIIDGVAVNATVEELKSAAGRARTSISLPAYVSGIANGVRNIRLSLFNRINGSVVTLRAGGALEIVELKRAAL